MEGIVFATGQKARAKCGPWRWFGLRAAARKVPIESDLEMHLLKSGYVGICRLNEMEVNICGLFRTEAPENTLARDWRSWLRGPSNSVLHQRLQHAEFLEQSFVATAGLDYRPFRGSEPNRCRLGDQLTLITPISGNGMSMAIESGELAVTPLADYSAGRTEWSEVVRQIDRETKIRFRTRVWIGFTVQSILFGAGSEYGVVPLLGKFPALIRLLYAKTR